MAAPTFRQKKQLQLGGGTGPHAAAFDVATIAGNLLTCAIYTDSAVDTIPTPAGWSVLLPFTQTRASGSIGAAGAVFWRKSNGLTTFNLTFGTSADHEVILMEHPGLTNPVPYTACQVRRDNGLGYAKVPSIDYPAGPAAILTWCVMEGGPQSGASMAASGTGHTLRTPVAAGDAQKHIAGGDILRDGAAGSTGLYPTAGSPRFLFTGSEPLWAAGAAFVDGASDVIAAFTGSPLFGPGPLEVTLTNQSTGDPDLFLWDFGDGTTSTDENPVHEYAEPGLYTITLTATRSSDDAEDTETKVAYVLVTNALAWDVFAADDLLGPPIATLENASGRMLRLEEDGAGVGAFTINRHSPEATEAILAKGNLVRCRFPEISIDYLGAFFLENGDFDILSSSEAGAEDLRFGGAGVFSYLHRARMDPVAYSTGLDISDTWTEIWKTSKIANPVGSAIVGGDATYVYVISATTRKIYKVRQSDRSIVGSSPALWAGSTNYASGLGADPSDATILWVLEAPWILGGSGNTKIRKVSIAAGINAAAVTNTYDLGSAIHLTAIKADATHLLTTRYDTDKIQRRTKAAPGTVASDWSITYAGVAQTNPTGISVNGTQYAYWFAGKPRALIADAAAPLVITDVISTKGISAFGGDWSTEGGQEYFYPVSYTADVVWKYQVTVATPHDPVDGIWRLDEPTPGAILYRTIVEAKHADRPQHPIPELIADFDFDVDTDGNPWDSHPGTAEFTARIGDFLDETDQRLIPYGVTLQMDPYFRLAAYNADAFGIDRTSGAFEAGKVRVVGGLNAAEGLRRRLDDRRVDSHMVVMGTEGAFARVVDDDLGYVREGFLSTDLTDAGALEGTGEAELARQRRDADAQAVVIPWADGQEGHDALHGFYLPGPAGTNGHYWLGDTIRVHSGAASFDLNEQDRDIKAITFEELDNGAWRAVADLASVFTPIYDPVAPPTAGGSTSIGGTTGAGAVGNTTPAKVTVKDKSTGESYTGSTLQSEDIGVSQPATGVVELTVKRRKLADLSDAELSAIANGQGIAWNATTEVWEPVTLTAAYAAAIALRYTFSTTTTDADPGAGFVRLSNATQYLAVTLRADLADALGADVTNELDAIGLAISTTKGYLRLEHATDPTKWLVATISAIASPAGYRNITIANIAKSANSPLANGDPVIVSFFLGTLATAHSALSSIGINDHHNRDHASAHSNGGADEVSIENLGTAETDGSKMLSPDGTGGVHFVAAPGGGGGNVATDAIWDEAGDTAVGTGANAAVRRKNNDAATVAPTVNEDSGDGYAIGSRWLDTTNDVEYVCLDATVGAALWLRTTPSGGTDGQWTTYTPTLTAVTTNPTIGNGTLVGRYKLIDSKTCAVRISWQFGSTSAGGSGAYRFALPFAAHGTGFHALACWIVDQGTAFFSATAEIGAVSASLTSIIVADGTGARNLTHNMPMTWATGDAVVVEGVYQLA